MTDGGCDLSGKVRDIVRDALAVEVPGDDTDLFETGLLDSLSLVALIAEIEQSFGIELPLDDIDVERFRSVDAIASFVALNGGSDA